MNRDSNWKLLRLAENVENPRLIRLAEAASVSSNEHLQASVQQLLTAHSLQKKQYPFSEIPDQGSMRIGRTHQHQQIHLSKNSLNKHLLAVGQSGSGKTTLFYNLYEAVETPAWFFDLKQDHRHLLKDDEDLLVLPWTGLQFNPLKPPPGVPPRRWIQVFAEIFGHATALLSGSKNHLMKQLVELYKLYNLFEDLSKPYPSLHELEQLVKREKINYVRKQSNYRDRILNRLESMNLTAGTIFDCSEGHSIEELLQRDVVFEFDGLSRDLQNFLMEILFAYVYEYRMAQNQRGGSLRHVIFLDEGKRVFSVYKERQDASGIPEIDELTAKMREFGEGLMVADQEASKLTDSIKANTFTKVLLPTGSRKQFEAMTNAMNLSERQREYAQKLDVGEAIIQVGNRDPIPVKLDDHGLEKQVSDEELEKLQAEKWNQLSHTPRDSTPQFEQFLLADGPGDLDDPDIMDDPEQEIKVSQEADRLLEDAVKNAFKGLTERYNAFSSRYKGNKAKNELVDSGLVLERHVRTGDRMKLLQLTEKGREYVEEHLDLDTKQRGRGGIVHKYWQHRIKDAFEEAGWTAEIEEFDADVYATIGNTELAIEVAMGDNPREIEHVEKHLTQDFQVWIVCRTEEIQRRLQQRLQENELASDSVVFRLLRQFNDGQLSAE